MTKYWRAGWALPALFCCCLVAAAQAKPVAAPEILLTVGGEVARPVGLNAADLAKLPRQTARVTDRDGKEIVYEGFALADALKLAGVEFGTMLKGPSLGLYLVAEAADKFRVVFALPELDPVYTDRIIVVADKQNGAPLAAADGPLKLVVPGEKRRARWLRQLTTLNIRRAN